MKIHLLIVSVLALNLCALAQTSKPTARNLEGLTGDVKRIDEQEAEVKSTGGLAKTGSKRFTRSLIFDRKGRVSRRQTSINGFDTRDFYYSYDKDGICHVRYTINDPRFDNSRSAAREQYSLHIFSYEQNENTVNETVYIGDKLLPENLTQRFKYKFDSNNRLVERVMMTPTGSPAVTDEYSYAAESNPIERRLQAYGGTKPQVIKYSYVLDARGNWIERTEENTLADKNKTTRIIITYRKVSYY